MQSGEALEELTELGELEAAAQAEAARTGAGAKPVDSGGGTPLRDVSQSPQSTTHVDKVSLVERVKVCGLQLLMVNQKITCRPADLGVRMCAKVRLFCCALGSINSKSGKT